jgi:hypothetical protein
MQVNKYVVSKSPITYSFPPGSLVIRMIENSSKMIMIFVLSKSSPKIMFGKELCIDKKDRWVNMMENLYSHDLLSSPHCVVIAAEEKRV